MERSTWAKEMEVHSIESIIVDRSRESMNGDGVYVSYRMLSFGCICKMSFTCM
jgi:hypothetical protein